MYVDGLLDRTRYGRHFTSPITDKCPKVGEVITLTDPHCIFFRPSATNRDICAKWVRSLKGEWFCLADDVCETQGMRLMPETQLIQRVREVDVEVEVED